MYAHFPEQRFDVPRALATQRRWGRPETIDMDRPSHDARQAVVRAALDRIRRDHDVQVVSLEPAFCDSKHCPVQGPGGEVLYADASHITAAAARRHADLWRPALRPERPAGAVASR